MTAVLVIGVFDLFHRGHLEFLTAAGGLGSRLVVAVNTDRKAARYKRQPVIAEHDRLAIVAGLRCVDNAELFDSNDILPLVIKHRPTVVVHGDDWTRERYLSHIGMSEEGLKKYSLTLKIIPYYAPVSTSSIVAAIQQQRGPMHDIGKPLESAKRIDLVRG